MRDPDRVGDLHLRPRRQTGRHDVLGHPAHRVGAGAIDLGGVLARERAAAVAGGAAVGVDDDLAAGQAGVAHRAAGHEPPGRVDQHEARLGQPLVRAQVRRDHRHQHVLDHVGADLLLVVHVGMVLGRDQHPLHRHRHQPAVPLAVAHRHLGLAVRPQVGHRLRLARGRQPGGDALRELDRQRHLLRRLVAGVAEHHALVARALRVDVAVGAVVLKLVGGVDAAPDVGRLLVERHHHAAGRGVEAEVGAGVPDVADDPANDAGDVDVGVGGDLAGHHHQAGRAEHLAGDTAVAILGQHRVQNPIGDLVGDLVRVPLGDRLGREQELAHGGDSTSGPGRNPAALTPPRAHAPSGPQAPPAPSSCRPRRCRRPR